MCLCNKTAHAVQWYDYFLSFGDAEMLSMAPHSTTTMNKTKEQDPNNGLFLLRMTLCAALSRGRQSYKAVIRVMSFTFGRYYC